MRQGKGPVLPALNRTRCSTHTLGCSSAVPLGDRCSDFPGPIPTLLLSRLFCCLSCLARWRLTCPIPRELQQGGVQPTASSAMNSPVWAPVLSACLECPGDSLPAAFIVLTKSSGTFYLWSNRGTLIERKGADTAIFPLQILTRKKKKIPLLRPFSFPNSKGCDS